MPGPVVTNNYVACCICTGQPNLGLWPGNPKYLPIPRTLYCTWGSWSGNLIWDNPSPVAWMPAGYQHFLWSGVATIPFNYRVEGPYYECDPTILAGTAECVVSFSCYGFAGWSVRAKLCVGTYGCLELYESQSYMTPGGAAYCRSRNACYGCDGEFSAVLTGDPNWVNVPPISDQPWYLWCHNVCDLQTSNCYISE